VSEPSRPLAFFLPTLHGGGAQRVMLNLADAVAGRGHEVDLLVSQWEGAYAEQIPDSVNRVDLRAPRVLASIPALVRYLRERRPAAVLSAMNHANIVAIWARALARTGTRLAVSEHNTLSVAHQNELRRRGRLIPRLIGSFYPWADEVIAVSQGVADDLAAVVGIPRGSIEVVYNPVVTPGLTVAVSEPLDHAWFAPGAPPVILAVGRLKPQKDFPMLLAAFARLREKRPARLVILGEGPERAALEALVKELDIAADVSLPGYVDNPYPYMARASVFALSSRWEGLPTVLIEALYCGAAVVSTDCPSGPREILRDGKYGRLTPTGDPVAFASSLEAALEAPRPASSHEDAWSPFTLDTIVDQYVSLMLGDTGCVS
jgi:glycosyltransferase involved in cell wall biosynthesis